MDIKDYHSHTDSISCSGLKLMLQTPAHYWAAYLDPEREPQEPTAAMQLGTAWHAAMFEPEKFSIDFARVPEGIDKRSKEGKSLFADLESAGKTPMRADDHDLITKMVKRAKQHDDVVLIFSQSNTRAEYSIFHTFNDVNVRIRPDFYVPACDEFPNGIIIDGKTTTDASPEGFGKQCFNLHYLMQAAFYSDVMADYNCGGPVPDFAFIAQEKSAPYLVAVYRPTADQIEYGRMQYKKALALYQQCKSSDSWPGYETGINDLILPQWAQKQVDGDDAIVSMEIIDQQGE